MFDLWRKAAPAAAEPEPGEALSGASFLQLEPDLAKEAGLNGRRRPGGAFLPE